MSRTSLRGLQILEVLAGMRQPAGLGEIAERTGLSESYAYRILQALEREGYLHHLGRSGYRMASRSIALAALIGPRPAMLRLLYPAVARLASSSGQAVAVHLRAGDARVLVLGVPGPSGPVVDPAGVLGERSALTAGASGRIILAYLDETELARINFKGVDQEHLSMIRRRGYETSFGENHPGINGVSAPLLAVSDGTQRSTAFGSVTIAGPQAQMSPQRLDELSRPLSAVVRDLGPRLAGLLGPNLGATIAALDL